MIKELELFSPLLQKVRLGNPCDGGYVSALQAICKSESLFSYGVGTDISMELDYIEATNKKAFLFDHTIDTIQIPEHAKDKMEFFKEGLSSSKQEKTDSFLSHYEKHFESEWDSRTQSFSDKVLFKCDIEGAEYEFLLNTDLKKMSDITTGLLFEFHSLTDPNIRDKFFKCLHEINKYFYLCHIHGNNYGRNFDYFEERHCSQLDKNYIEKFSLPSDIELSFVNKSIVKGALKDYKKYPCQFLDKQNNIWNPDSDLTFLHNI
jgi:hypothetical protein